MLLAALGVALVMLTIDETGVAVGFRGSLEVFYAADAALDLAVQELVRETDWSLVLTGLAEGSLGDRGSGSLPDGTPVAIDDWTAALQAETDSLYSGAPDRPVWQVYLYGPLACLVDEGSIATRAFVAVWVGDDAGDGDGDPAGDGNGAITVRAEAFGDAGAHKAIEATLRRRRVPDPDGGPDTIVTRLVSWREIR
jgi:hypothetical protein